MFIILYSHSNPSYLVLHSMPVRCTRTLQYFLQRCNVSAVNHCFSVIQDFSTNGELWIREKIKITLQYEYLSYPFCSLGHFPIRCWKFKLFGDISGFMGVFLMHFTPACSHSAQHSHGFAMTQSDGAE